MIQLSPGQAPPELRSLFIRACEGLGYRTYWICARQNRASAAVARKLGFRTEREYRLWAWFK
jgi:RimJ/RimL family protein N-acetyltransferase